MKRVVYTIPGVTRRYEYGYTAASTRALTVDPNTRKGKNTRKRSRLIWYFDFFTALYVNMAVMLRKIPYTVVLIQLYPDISVIGEMKYFLKNS